MPLDLTCDGAMLATFPKPHMPVKEGPPAPQGPTLVHFERNVVVRRGKLTEQPDQLDSDNLDLTLVPSEKPAPAPGKTPAAGSKPGNASPAANSAQTQVAGQTQATEGGASSGEGEQKGVLGDLVLQRVKATGHAVWLRSPSKGVRIFCNELLHKIMLPESPNLTYWVPTRLERSLSRNMTMSRSDPEDRTDRSCANPSRSLISGQSMLPWWTAAAAWKPQTCSPTAPADGNPPHSRQDGQPAQGRAARSYGRLARSDDAQEHARAQRENRPERSCSQRLPAGRGPGSAAVNRRG